MKGKIILILNLKAQTLWFKIVRIMIMMILILISSQIVQIANHDHHQILMIMRIINLKA
jgi:hypothetical protein